ncbi:hypothetical protein NHX12_022707 [Muraenolepis orangiensis]|uniref:DBB domain-containing protein n=1 Tax=Muraenolepis orangiensis TaxID=630683 RepID=A0A9Q0IUC6_9TELE|nr:hypothetical protein NHX12_022707 [Muraenolepis orangiensis]
MEEISDSCQLLILHTAEAQEWAEYLNAVLTSFSPFQDSHSVTTYTVSLGDRRHGYDYDERFRRRRCIVLVLTTALLDLLSSDERLHIALQRLLSPPRRVVALLCGVSEEGVPAGSFPHWPSWGKLHPEDEPGVYISTVLEAMADSRQDEADSEREAQGTMISSVEAANQNPREVAEEPEAEEYLSAEEGEPDLTADASSGEEKCPREEECLAPCSSCLTVQPNRILCGERTTIFIILLHRVDIQSKAEVSFSSENRDAQRIPALIENEYTISVIAPDMPAGLALPTLFLSDQSSVRLTPVTYYTCMNEVSRYLEDVTSPIEFICQAFNITSNKTESLDSMLTDLLKSRMPVGGLQLFGIKQIELNNMSTYQRNEELPTLLHFAARYGLKKLTTALLHCPGALQAYSVMNKHGDYPNTLAEHSGFSDLRQFMDAFVETADMLNNHIEDEDNECEYEMMEGNRSLDIVRYSGHTEDIYESMLDINPECADDLYEVMTGSAEDQNPEEAMLRKFFQAKPGAGQSQEEQGHLETTDTEEFSQDHVRQHREDEEEEEGEEVYNTKDGPYNTEDITEDIYDAVDNTATYPVRTLNRPPAPMPRPKGSESLDTNPYISRVFSDKITPPMRPVRKESAAVEPVEPAPHSSSSLSDTYSGVKTPGQRQLIALQERVKLGVITVEQAVQEFKTWQFDHERRANSLRYQEENLKRLRNSITRRHKERQKKDKNVDLEITAPIQSTRDVGDSGFTVECSVYNCPPQAVSPPAAVSRPIQRGNWKTGSTSSTSSTESNRFSTHSIISSSSGTEPDFEDTVDIFPPPPPPPRLVRAPSRSPPARPNLPPPVPERNPEPMQHERYISCPTRTVPQRPVGKAPTPPPPVPRRLR